MRSMAKNHLYLGYQMGCAYAKRGLLASFGLFLPDWSYRQGLHYGKLVCIG